MTRTRMSVPGAVCHQQDLARLQPPLGDDFVLRDLQHNHLGRHQVGPGDQTGNLSIFRVRVSDGDKRLGKKRAA
jgi:hypothetical protein